MGSCCTNNANEEKNVSQGPKKSFSIMPQFKSVTTGHFVFPNSKFSYELKNELHKIDYMVTCMEWASHLKNKVFTRKQTNAEALDEDRKCYEEDMKEYVEKDEVNLAFLAKAMIDVQKFNAGEYDGTGEARDIEVIIAKKVGGVLERKPCLIYYHGGGTVALSAHYYKTIFARYAVDNDIVVIGVDYRLAPETPSPGGMLDNYAAIKWTIANAHLLGVDASRIAIGGESGGGNMTLNVCIKLVEMGEENLVKFVMASAVMCAHPWMNPISEIEEMNKANMIMESAWLAGIEHCDDYEKENYPKIVNRRDIFPAELCEDEILAKFPPTIVFTSEFDLFGRSTEQLAERLHKVGRLVDFVIHPGTTHVWFVVQSHPTAGDYFKDQKIAFDTWLH